MKPSLRFSTPLRRSWRSGAFFGVKLGAALLALALLNRSIAALTRLSNSQTAHAKIPAVPTLEPPQTPKNAAHGFRNGSRSIAQNGSLSAALARIDARTVQAYFARWSQQPKAAAPRAKPAIFIDTDVLARRHPAWQLANELEVGVLEPSSPQILRALSAPAANAVLPGLPVSDAPNSGAPDEAARRATPKFVPGAMIAAGARAASSGAQNAALDNFLAHSATRDEARARDGEFLARRALDETVAQAQGRAISALDLPLLAPDIALQLINLRLDLLRNLPRSAAQRAATREEIRAIEARYNEILKNQTDAQAARLRVATIEIPAQMRHEGLARIESQTRAAASENARARREIALETRARLRRDFAPDATLRLRLPPFHTLPASSAPFLNSLPAAAVPPLSSANSRQFFETAGGEAASKAPLEPSSALLARHRALVALRLRAQARREATQWARIFAASRGAVPVFDGAAGNSGHAPDETARAMRAIFPSFGR